jgi:SAM-dependent methyltransferase
MNDVLARERSQSTSTSLVAASSAGITRKTRLLQHSEAMASTIGGWVAKNKYYHECDIAYLRFLIPRNKRVLELGSGIGNTLASLEPSIGIGVDFSPEMVREARRRHSTLTIIEGDIEDRDVIERIQQGPFDVILLSDTIGSLEDCQTTLELLHAQCGPETRIVLSYYSHLWEPVLRISESLGLKMPQPTLNFLRLADVANLIDLAGFQLVKQEQRILLPKLWLGLGTVINRFIAPLPLFRRLCLRHYTVARSRRVLPKKAPSCSIIIPCRNERGNIRNAIGRMPLFCDDQEVIFVEGHSRDGTREEINRLIASYDGPIKLSVVTQDEKGKGEAVRKGFKHASGEILMILDADLTVPPEDLPKFYKAIAGGDGEFINGSRLVYPMEQQAMRFLNLLANAVFARLFSWLLNQRVTDTLCGTKVLRKSDYDRIADGRVYFGDFDPFGDFDLIFGASKLNLKIIEIPIRYSSRDYGETQISRFSHGWLLLRMVVLAFRKLKAF